MTRYLPEAQVEDVGGDYLREATMFILMAHEIDEFVVDMTTLVREEPRARRVHVLVE